MKSHQSKGIFDPIAVGQLKASQHGKTKEQTAKEEKSHQKAECLQTPHGQSRQKAACGEKVKGQKGKEGQARDPDHGRLLEILLKGVKKAPDQLHVVPLNQLHGHIVLGRNGSPGRNNGQADRQSQEIQKKDIDIAVEGSHQFSLR